MSMIKSQIIAKKGVDVFTKYPSLLALMKKKLDNHSKKKAPVFEQSSIERYFDLPENNPSVWENFKVVREKFMALISIYGGLRGSELYKMTFKDVNVQKVGEDVSGITITIPQHKTKKKKEDGFTFQLHSRYLSFFNFVPDPDKHFWLNMNPRSSKITDKSSNMGQNETKKLGVCIARRLGIPNPETYSSHCMRRTAATLLANSGISLIGLKNWGRWKSDSVAQGYVEQGIQSKTNTAADKLQVLSKVSPKKIRFHLKDPSCHQTLIHFLQRRNYIVP